MSNIFSARFSLAEAFKFFFTRRNLYTIKCPFSLGQDTVQKRTLTPFFEKNISLKNMTEIISQCKPWGHIFVTIFGTFYLLSWFSTWFIPNLFIWGTPHFAHLFQTNWPLLFFYWGVDDLI